MNPKGKKSISLFLVISLVMLSTNLYAKERQGAEYLSSARFGQLVMFAKLWFAYNKSKQGDMHECQKENHT